MQPPSFYMNGVLLVNGEKSWQHGLGPCTLLVGVIMVWVGGPKVKTAGNPCMVGPKILDHLLVHAPLGLTVQSVVVQDQP